MPNTISDNGFKDGTGLSSDYMQWWRDARFGLMIHWGLYSQLGGEWNGRRQRFVGEWIMSDFRIPVDQYAQLAGEFNPKGFNADEWVRLAKRAGMGYLIITAKHHDGFAMYHSKADSYNIVDATPYAHDPMADLAAACAKHGVKLCFYYSQSLDWHEFGGGGFDATQKNFGTSWCNDWDFSGRTTRDFDLYFENKAIPQVTELLTQYGAIGALWFDCPFTLSAEQSQRLYDLVKSLQPTCIVNNRLGNGIGDYSSFGDNQTSAQVMEGDWETVATLNDTWGYKSFDTNWKSAKDVLSLLTQSVSRNINYVLNIGPDSLGRFPQASLDVLEQIGDWMEVNGESVHQTMPSPFVIPPANTSVTHRPNRVYFHMQSPRCDLAVSGLRNAVHDVHVLGHSDRMLEFEQTDSMLYIKLPSEIVSEMIPVVAVGIDGTADVSNIITQQSDGSVILPVSAADIHSEHHETTHQPGHVEPDGKRYDVSTDASVSPMGAMVNWLDTSTWLSWQFTTHKAGQYEISVVSTGLYHSNPWQGGHRVCVEVDGCSIEAVMQQDQTVDDVAARYYTQAISIIGSVSLDNRDEHQLTLKADDIKFNNGVGLSVMSVRLRCMGEI